MSNNNQGPKYLYVEGQAVLVDEQIYTAYYHYERKERYFEYDLKVEHFKVDEKIQAATFLPSREDSYERLLENGQQFSNESGSVETEAILNILFLSLKEAMLTLTSEEAHLIELLFYKQQSEREVGRILGISKTSVRRRREKILKKLRKILEKM